MKRTGKMSPLAGGRRDPWWSVAFLVVVAAGIPACDRQTTVEVEAADPSLARNNQPTAELLPSAVPGRTAGVGVQAVLYALTSDCALAVSDEEALNQLEVLAGTVDGLEESGSLNRGQARGLRNHLDNVIRHIAAGRACPAIAQVRALGEQVENFVEDGILTPAEAEAFRRGVAVILGTTLTLTHSASQAIVAGNSVACSPDAGVTTTENGYLRTFALDDFNVGGAFNVTEVSFGIESVNNVPEVTVNLYTLDAGPFVFSNLTLIGSASAAFTTSQSLVVATVPITGTAAAGSILVAEVAVPDRSGVGAFFIGSNAAGQTAPSYLRSASCDVPEPTDLANIGSPNMHIVMNVAGFVTP